MTESVKECPFCGVTGSCGPVVDGDFVCWRYFCDNEQCSVKPSAMTLNAWNTRYCSETQNVGSGCYTKEDKARIWIIKMAFIALVSVCYCSAVSNADGMTRDLYHNIMTSAWEYAGNACLCFLIVIM